MKRVRDMTSEEILAKFAHERTVCENWTRIVGYHRPTTEWNKGKRACTVALSPDDAETLGLSDGQQVRVTTEAGSEVGELQVTDQVRQGMVLIPHGFGLIYDGEVYGINVNRLTKNTHRDPMGTPLHRFVPCRVEAV